MDHVEAGGTTVSFILTNVAGRGDDRLGANKAHRCIPCVFRTMEAVE
jgi:hypothetical protein